MDTSIWSPDRFQYYIELSGGDASFVGFPNETGKPARAVLPVDEAFGVVLDQLLQYEILTAVTGSGRAIRYGVQCVPKVVIGPGHTVSYHTLESALPSFRYAR